MIVTSYAIPPVHYRQRTVGETELEHALWRQIYDAALRSTALAKALGMSDINTLTRTTWPRVVLFPGLHFEDVIDRAEQLGVLSVEEGQFLRFWRANDEAGNKYDARDVED